jgi:poly-gamma-glutamate capsule biosynthesis protein CapA/YwtB (metallophosphatase superfamily)
VTGINKRVCYNLVNRNLEPKGVFIAMKRVQFLFLIISVTLLFFIIGITAGTFYPPEVLFGQNADHSNYEDENAVDDQDEEEFEPDLRSVKLICAGNIFPHTPQIEQAHIGDGVYDFTPSFEFIAPFFEQGDIVVADLETSQAGPDISFAGVRGYTGYPLFNTPQELSVALKEAGVDILTLGNNHALDRGYDGLLATIDHLHSIGVKTFGAYKSQEERDQILIIEHDGINIAFIGYTFSTNGIPVPEGHEYCINFAPGFTDLTDINADIRRARNEGADLVAVFAHWGDDEYNQEPQPQRLREVATELAEVGADLIIGGHPKFVQPLEWFFSTRSDGSERATLAIYSQGTLLSNQHYPANVSPRVEYHLLLDIVLTKNMDSGEAWISKVDHEVTWIHRLWRHRILPLSAVFESDPSEYNLTVDQIEELRSWHERTIEAAEAYGYSEDKVKAMALSEKLFEKAHQAVE